MVNSVVIFCNVLLKEDGAYLYSIECRNRLEVFNQFGEGEDSKFLKDWVSVGVIFVARYYPYCFFIYFILCPNIRKAMVASRIILPSLIPSLTRSLIHLLTHYLFSHLSLSLFSCFSLFCLSFSSVCLTLSLSLSPPLLLSLCAASRHSLSL
jgi:hypothetical protein